MLHQKLLIILLIFIISIANVYGQEIRSTIVEADGYVYLSEDKTIRQIRNEARMEAKRLAIERGEVHIQNLTTVENYKLKYDIIKSSAEGMLKILDYKDYGFTTDNRYHYWIKAEIRYALKSKPPQILGEAKAPELSGPLTVKVWSAKDKYKAGEQMKFYMRGNKDFYARVIYIDAKDNKLQLVPNQYNSNSYFQGNKDIELPAPGSGFSITVSPPFGKERVVVYSSTKPLGDIIATSGGGPMLQVNDDMSVIEVQTRGVRIDKNESAEFFETSCKIKTSK